MKHKYNEDNLLNELKEYIDSTYSQHYTSKDGIQTNDLIFKDPQRGLAFCTSNCIKYLDRAGKKEDQGRKDLLKNLHYGLLALYNYDRLEK